MHIYSALGVWLRRIGSVVDSTLAPGEVGVNGSRGKSELPQALRANEGARAERMALQCCLASESTTFCTTAAPAIGGTQPYAAGCGG